jgi:YesN/AraC family two-component response regulator
MALDAYKEIKFFKNDKEEMFMVFEFLPIEKEEYENKKIHEIYYRLNQNTQLYINRSLVMGVSPSFNNHYEVDTYYEKAYRALCQKFYETSNVIFYHETEKNTFKLILDIKWLVEKNGEEKFYDSIKSYLESCKRKYITPDEVKGKILKKFHLYIEETVKMEYLENKKDEIMQYDLSYEEVQQIKTAKSLLFITLKHFKQLKNKLNEELQERDTFYSVLNYIDQHYNEQLSLADVAAQKFMSVNYFCQIFKKHTGTTFVNYINQKRVNEVKLLLKEEKLTLEQISQKTGFYNVNYMVRLFKKTTGFTIREYRKTLKK